MPALDRLNPRVIALAGGIAVAIAAMSSAGCGGEATSGGAAPQSAHEAITSFDEFPVLWLGDSYDSDGDSIGDMPLGVARPSRGEPIVDPTTGRILHTGVRSFDLTYGDCEIPRGKQSCTVPITIHFYPPSSAPKLAPGLVTNTVPLRGIDAMQYGPGQMMVNSADVVFTVQVFDDDAADSDSQAIRIVNSLRGANPKASQITQTSDFAPAPRTTQ